MNAGLAQGWATHEDLDFVISKTYGSPASSSKIAAFDLDGTLVVSGVPWHREGSITFSRPNVREKLWACVERGEHVAVFSNQGTIRGALHGRSAWTQTTRMDAVHAALGHDVADLPMTVVFATAAERENDPHRKPGRGMWDLFVSKLAPLVGPAVPDASLSFYVGDAAGLGAFPGSDRGFAEAAGLRFLTPEEFFDEPPAVEKSRSGWKGAEEDYDDDYDYDYDYDYDDGEEEE